MIRYERILVTSPPSSLLYDSYPFSQQKRHCQLCGASRRRKSLAKLTSDGDRVDLQSPMVHEAQQLDVDHHLESGEATKKHRSKNLGKGYYKMVGIMGEVSTGWRYSEPPGPLNTSYSSSMESAGAATGNDRG